MGRFLRSAKGFAAEVERERIKERTGRGMRARAAAGRIASSSPRYGYVRSADGGKYVAQEPQASTVRRIFRAYTQGGAGLRAIAASLNADGIPAARGGRWSAAQLSRLLRSEMYSGRAEMFVSTEDVEQARRNGTKSHRVARPQEERVRLPEGTVEPLVSVADWLAAQARLVSNGQDAARRNGDPEGTLLRGGYVRCADPGCGGSMVVVTRRGDAYYACTRARNGAARPHSNAIKAADLDRDVWAILNRLRHDPALLRERLAQQHTEDGTAGHLESLERALADVTRQQTRLAGRIALLEDDLVVTPLLAELTRLGQAKQQMEAERATLAARAAETADVEARLAETESAIARGDLRDDLTWAERREWLRTFAVVVRVLPTALLAAGERRWRLETALLTDAQRDVERARNRAAHATGLPRRWSSQPSDAPVLVWTDADVA